MKKYRVNIFLSGDRAIKFCEVFDVIAGSPDEALVSALDSEQVQRHHMPYNKIIQIGDNRYEIGRIIGREHEFCKYADANVEENEATNLPVVLHVETLGIQVQVR